MFKSAEKQFMRYINVLRQRFWLGLDLPMFKKVDWPILAQFGYIIYRFLYKFLLPNFKLYQHYNQYQHKCSCRWSKHYQRNWNCHKYQSRKAEKCSPLITRSLNTVSALFSWAALTFKEKGRSPTLKVAGFAASNIPLENNTDERPPPLF